MVAVGDRGSEHPPIADVVCVSAAPPAAIRVGDLSIRSRTVEGRSALCDRLGSSIVLFTLRMVLHSRLFAPLDIACIPPELHEHRHSAGQHRSGSLRIGTPPDPPKAGSWPATVLALAFGAAVSHWGLVQVPRYYDNFSTAVTAVGTLREIRDQPDLSKRCNTFLRAGYVISYRLNARGFVVVADPLIRGKTGMRSFYMDETGIIRANALAPATIKDKPI